MQTPGKKVLSLLLIGFYVGNLLIVWRAYFQQLAMGEFPPEADSIGIPMAGYFLLWLVGIPVLALAVLLIFRSQIVRESLFSMNRTRPITSILISVAAVFLITWDVFYLIEERTRLDVIDVGYTLFEIYLIACLRTVSIFWRRSFNGDSKIIRSGL
jgi:hypothetical protein